MARVLRRALYILYRVAEDVVSLVSRALNALLFGGSTAQTLSARAHVDAPRSRAWDAARRVINAIFFWQDDHCAWAWQAEVERARHVLAVLERRPS